MKESFGKKLVLRGDNKNRIVLINDIIEDYNSQGYKLTLRQLYYQLVSKDIIPNRIEEYQKLSTLLNKGRMCGYVDWDAIVDRTRNPKKPYWEESPKSAIENTLHYYALDRHAVQDVKIEVWIEKDALSEIIYRAIYPYHITMMVNRGYSSATAMYESYKRFSKAICEEKKCVIFYMGDHDPSGLDMIRDIKERLVEMLLFGDSIKGVSFDDYDEAKEWIDERFEVKPLALTTQQVRLYNPPPNPAKLQDPRATKYVEEFGYTSWEVDALNPKTLNKIITDNIESYIDIGLHEQIIEREKEDKRKLRELIQSLNN